MAQGSIEPSGAQSGAAFSAAVRAAFAATATWFAGASAPAAAGQPFAYQFWIDTAAGLIKQRNAANTAWVTLGLVDTWLVNALLENGRGEVLDADRTQYLYSADLVSVEGTVLTAVSLTLDTNTATASAGGNCLDAGAWATNTWYAIWLVCSADGSAKALLASTSATAPTLPAAFTRKRRVGWARTSGTATSLWPLLQAGNKAIWSSSHFADHSALTWTATPASAYTDVDCSAIVPPGTRLAKLTCQFGSDPTWSGTPGTACYFLIRTNGSTATGDVRAALANVSQVAVADVDVVLDGSRLCEYRIELFGSAVSTDFSAAIAGRGWYDGEQQ
jgi:hypothetical protein